MNKFTGTLTLTGLFLLAGCSTEEEVLIETNAGSITKEQAIERGGEDFGQDTLEGLVIDRAITEKYGPSEKIIEEEFQAFEQRLKNAGNEDYWEQDEHGKEAWKESRALYIAEERAVAEMVAQDKTVMEDFIEENPESFLTVNGQLFRLDTESEQLEAKEMIKEGTDFDSLYQEFIFDEEVSFQEFFLSDLPLEVRQQVSPIESETFYPDLEHGNTRYYLYVDEVGQMNPQDHQAATGEIYFRESGGYSDDFLENLFEKIEPNVVSDEWSDADFRF